MKRIFTFTFASFLLLSASFASAQSFGAGMMGSSFSGYQGTAQAGNTIQAALPMFGLTTQPNGQALTATQGNTAQDSLSAFMPMLQFFGSARTF
jgi:hypothetical protein